MATAWKRSVSESSITSVTKLPRALLWCQLFRPRISCCGCALLVLCATCFVAAVSINRGLVAWSSIFAAETVVPKGAIHQAGWRAETRNITTGSVPTVRPTRPATASSGAQQAKKALDRRRPRKVAAAESVRLAKEDEPEMVVPPANIEITAPGGDQGTTTVSHRPTRPHAKRRQRKTARSKPLRELPGEDDKIIPEQETPLPTDLPSVAETRPEDNGENPPETSSESDDSTTVSQETEANEMSTTHDMPQPLRPRVAGDESASPESANTTDFSAAAESEANDTTPVWKSGSENSSEADSHGSEVTSVSSKLPAVTESSETPSYIAVGKQTASDSSSFTTAQSGSAETSRESQLPTSEPSSSTPSEASENKTMPSPTKMNKGDEELPTNESSSTTVETNFNMTFPEDSEDDDEEEEESTSSLSVLSTIRVITPNVPDGNETKPELNASAQTESASVTSSYSSNKDDSNDTDEVEGMSTATSFIPSADNILTYNATDLNETELQENTSAPTEPVMVTASHLESSVEKTGGSASNYSIAEISSSLAVEVSTEEASASVERANVTDIFLTFPEDSEDDDEEEEESTSSLSVQSTIRVLTPNVPDGNETKPEVNASAPTESASVTSSYSPNKGYNNDTDEVEGKSTAVTFIPPADNTLTYNAMDLNETELQANASAPTEPVLVTASHSNSSAETTVKTALNYSDTEITASPMIEASSEAEITAEITGTRPTDSVEVTVQTIPHRGAVTTPEPSSTAPSPGDMAASAETSNATDITLVFTNEVTEDADSNDTSTDTTEALAHYEGFSVSTETFGLTNYTPASSNETTEYAASNHSVLETSEAPGVNSSEEQTSASVEPSNVTDLMTVSSAKTTEHMVETSKLPGTRITLEESTKPKAAELSSAYTSTTELEPAEKNETETTLSVEVSAELITAPANVSLETETTNVTVPDATAAVTEGDEDKKSRTRRNVAHEHVECNTTFCEAEASYLSGIFDGHRDPCDNFYEFACADWQATSSDLQRYDTADDAVTGFVEEMTRTVLEGGTPAEFQPLFNLWNACKQTGVVTDDELKRVLASLGLNVSKATTAKTSDVLHAAGTLLYVLDNAPILSVELVTSPSNASTKLIALGEPDILVSRVDAHAENSRKKLSALACKYFSAWAYSGVRNDTLCDAVADVAFVLAKSSRLDQHVTEKMNLYGIASQAYIRMFMPLLSLMNGTEEYMGENATYVVKNVEQVGALKGLLTAKPNEVLAYMAFHTMVYLSPFLQRKEDLWGNDMFMLTGHQRPQPVPKWRLCLRLVDRLLPGPLVVLLEKADASTPSFADIMAEVMVEEVRSAFIDEVAEIERLENWTKHMLTLKAQSIGVHTFFMAQYAINVFVNDTMQKVQEEVPWNNSSPFEYFLNVNALVAKDWANPMRHPLIEKRRGLSLFDPDCDFNPHENVVVVPLAMFNLSMPTSARERMFQIPRMGTRISACLFRATFSYNFYNPTDFIPMEHTTRNLNNTLNCLTPHYKNEGQATSGFEKVEDCTAVTVAYETFQKRLFSKQYLDVDYRLQGLGNVTANQLFFVYYALSRCGRPDLSGGGIKAVLQDSVNVPLMNLPEFASSFHCPEHSPMNPKNRCSFWN